MMGGGFDLRSNARCKWLEKRNESKKVVESIQQYLTLKQYGADEGINSLNVNLGRRIIPLQEYLATVRPISQEEGHMFYGFSFDIVGSMPGIIENLGEEVGIQSGLEAQEILDLFEKYTFTKDPEFRDAFFSAFRKVKFVRKNSLSKKTYFQYIRRGLQELRNKTKPKTNGLLTQLERERYSMLDIEAEYNDLPVFNPIDFLTPLGRDKIKERSALIRKINTNFQDKVISLVGFLNNFGDQYRNYLLEE